jgi:hypothetical protein
VVLKERKLSSEGFLLTFLIDGGLELERCGLFDWKSRKCEPSESWFVALAL